MTDQAIMGMLARALEAAAFRLRLPGEELECRRCEGLVSEHRPETCEVAEALVAYRKPRLVNASPAGRPVLEPNPLDALALGGKSPSYQELTELYFDLWALMVQQRERAEKAEALAAEEREACARVAEADMGEVPPGPHAPFGLVRSESRGDGRASEAAALRIASSIRARGCLAQGQPS